MEGEKVGLSVLDYAIFSLMLIISAAIGVYFRFSGSKQKTTKEYLLAGQDMSIFPVAFSIMASFISATAMIGTSMEVYNFGVHMAYLNLTGTVGMIISSYMTLPVYFEMRASTIYEYVSIRFGKFTRTLTSGAFIFQMILFMSVVLYAPALALSAVTNMSMWVSIVAVGIVCTFYCTIGGMKAVLWTDVFQSFLMFFGIITVLLKGVLDIGLDDVLRIAKEGRRLEPVSFEFSMYQRYNAWNLIVHGILSGMSVFSANQVQVQRLLTLKNIKRSRWALFASFPLSISLYLLVIFTGLVVYAYFADCDPLTPPNNPISRGDQLLPYFIMKILSKYPGLPGLCISGVFSASLSTVSSCVNSLSAVTMQDLVRPFLLSKGVSEGKLSFIAQLTTLFYGFLCIALTFVFATVGSLVHLSTTIFGCLGGPVLGIFLLGMLTTRSNEKGANIGFLVGVGVASWIGFSIVAHSSMQDKLPVSIQGCPQTTNFTLVNFINKTEYSNIKLNNSIGLYNFKHQSYLNEESNSSKYIFPLYRISFLWIICIGFLLTYIIGYFSSVLINIISGNTKEVAPELISPFVKFFNSAPNTKEQSMNMKELNEMVMVKL